MEALHRLNTRISNDLNAWLDKVSEETGLSKSAITMVALEQYRIQRQSVHGMGEIIERLDRLEKKLGE